MMTHNSTLPSMASSWLFLAMIALSVLAMTSARRNDFIVETRIVVERSALDYWKASTGNSKQCQCRKEIRRMLIEVSEMFSHMKKLYGLGIHLAIQDISFISTDVLTSNNPSDDLKKWLRMKENQLEGKKVDLTILFTRKNMKYTSWDNRQVGAICTENSLGIVQLTGKKIDVIRTAHEIGHTLGSYHDYDRRNKPACKHESNLIMARDPENPPAAHRFSHCSYVSFYYKVYGAYGPVTCLLDGDMDDTLTRLEN